MDVLFNEERVSFLDAVHAFFNGLIEDLLLLHQHVFHLIHLLLNINYQRVNLFSLVLAFFDDLLEVILVNGNVNLLQLLNL